MDTIEAYSSSGLNSKPKLFSYMLRSSSVIGTKNALVSGEVDTMPYIG